MPQSNQNLSKNTDLDEAAKHHLLHARHHVNQVEHFLDAALKSSNDPSLLAARESIRNGLDSLDKILPGD
ncbi:MAG: hypothetical protein HQL69_21920 [Magnetococcales bacterium]|nr:hypothetical protein [Magnetococcales bacterium]